VQVLSGLASGAVKAGVKAKLNAAALFNSASDIGVPVSIWIPGQASWITEEVDQHKSGIRIVVTARTTDGRLAGAFEKFVDASFNESEWAVIEKKGLQVVANLTVPKLESLNIEAVLQFSNGEVGTGSTKLAISGNEESARLTSIFVTSRVDVVSTVPKDDPPALHIAKYQLSIPVTQQFTAADKLTVYLGIDNVTMDAAAHPRIALSLALKSGDKVVKDIPATSMYPFPQSKRRIFFLDQLDLAGLAPGKYALQATLKDLATNTTSTSSAEIVFASAGSGEGVQPLR
jgi:hypothetical protein